MLERPLRLLGNIHLAVAQPLDEVVGREIHELHGIGAIKYRNPAPSRARARA